MVTLRDGKQASSAADKQPTVSLKRRAPASEGEDKENKAPRKTETDGDENTGLGKEPTTPPRKENSTGLRDDRPTPGRKVPPRGSPPIAFRPETDPDEMRNPSPLPPPVKKRMNAFEKNGRFGQEALRDPNHRFHDLYICYEKGPKGSPTYDRAGFQLDYDEVSDWMNPKPYNKARIMRASNKSVEDGYKQKTRMVEIFFKGGKAPSHLDGVHDYCIDAGHWKDRVSEDMGVPWHKVTAATFEEWEKKGSPKQDPADWTSFTEEERK